MNSEEFKDLTGDPLYDHFKKHTKEGFFILSGRILEHKIAGPKQPRKEIEIMISNGKITEKYKYNYNKLLKELEKTPLIIT